MYSTRDSSVSSYPDSPSSRRFTSRRSAPPRPAHLLLRPSRRRPPPAPLRPSPRAAGLLLPPNPISRLSSPFTAPLHLLVATSWEAEDGRVRRWRPTPGAREGRSAHRRPRGRHGVACCARDERARVRGLEGGAGGIVDGDGVGGCRQDRGRGWRGRSASWRLRMEEAALIRCYPHRTTSLASSSLIEPSPFYKGIRRLEGSCHR